jgi:phosphate transport system substrate-binding protein
VEDSLTSGRITIVCAGETRALMVRERDAFQALYPQAHIELRAGTSREAIAALFGAECDLAVIARDLAPEERAAAIRGRLQLEGYRFARDGIVALTGAGNPVRNLTVEELRRIYSGESSSWSEFGGRPQPVVPVAQPPETDITESLVQQVMSGQPIQARSVVARGDSGVIAAVRSRAGAIGYATLAAADQGADVVRLASLKGLAYTRPDMESVYRGTYPLTRFFNMYVRASSRPLASGLVTFVTSMDGQKLVQQSGYVPTSVPVRFVRRSPLLGAH